MKVLKNLILIYFKFYFINLFFCNINANVIVSTDSPPFVNKNQIWPDLNDLDNSSFNTNESQLKDNDQININKYSNITKAILFNPKSENETSNNLLDNESINATAQLIKNNSSFANESIEKSKCFPKVDLVFLLDTSGSIEQIYQEHVRWAVALIDSLPIEQDMVRVAAVQYAGFPLTEFALGTYPNAQDIRQHLEQINFQRGATRTGYALRKAEAELFRTDRGARNDAKKVIVLFTDGLSIDDPLKPAQQLRNLKDVTIYVASVGNEGFKQEMDRIAGAKNNVFGPDDMPRLRESLITEAERARICVSIGARSSKIYEEKLAAKQTNNNKVNLTQPTKNKLEFIQLKKEIKPESLANQNQQENNINNLLELNSNSTNIKINETNFIITTIQTNESKQKNITDSILLINETIKANMNNESTTSVEDNKKNNNESITSIEVNSNEAEEILNMLPLEDVLIEKILSLNESTESKKNISTNQILSNSETLNELIKESSKNTDEIEKFNKLNQKLTQLEVSDVADVFEVNENNQKNMTFKTFSTTISTTLSKKNSSLPILKQSANKIIKKNLKMINLKPPASAILESRPSTITFKPFAKIAAFTTSGHPTQQIVENQTVRSSFNVNVSSNKGSVITSRQRSQLQSQIKSLSITPIQEKITTTSTTTKRPLTPTKNNQRTTTTKKITSTFQNHVTTSTKLPTTTITRNRAFASANRVLSQNNNNNLNKINLTCPTDWLFIVDSSGSIQKIYDQQKEYLTSILEQIPLGKEQKQRVSLLQFAGSENQKMEWSFDEHNDQIDLINAFNKVRLITGTTYIGAALEASIRVLKNRRRNVPCIIVLLSDGFSQDDSTIPANQLRREPNTDFYSVSISELSNENYLTSIVGKPENVFIGNDRATELRRVLLEQTRCRHV